MTAQPLRPCPVCGAAPATRLRGWLRCCPGCGPAVFLVLWPIVPLLARAPDLLRQIYEPGG